MVRMAREVWYRLVMLVPHWLELVNTGGVHIPANPQQ